MSKREGATAEPRAFAIGRSTSQTNHIKAINSEITKFSLALALSSDENISVLLYSKKVARKGRSMLLGHLVYESCVRLH